MTSQGWEEKFEKVEKNVIVGGVEWREGKDG